LKFLSDAKASAPYGSSDHCRFGAVGIFSRETGREPMNYKNAAGKRVTIPFHASKILHPKILKSILRDAELSVEKVLELL
jgi:hypothetical protein